MTLRPTINDTAIIEKLAKHFAPMVIDCIGDDDWDIWDVGHDLMVVFTLAMYFDGYVLARGMERHGDYRPNARLVSLLSGADRIADTLIREASIEWLPASGLIAPVIGSIVSCGEISRGSVEENYPDGKSLVCSGSDGLIVAWEKLTPIRE